MDTVLPQHLAGRGSTTCGAILLTGRQLRNPTTRYKSADILNCAVRYVQNSPQQSSSMQFPTSSLAVPKLCPALCPAGAGPVKTGAPAPKTIPLHGSHAAGPAGCSSAAAASRSAHHAQVTPPSGCTLQPRWRTSWRQACSAASGGAHTPAWPPAYTARASTVAACSGSVQGACSAAHLLRLPSISSAIT